MYKDAYRIYIFKDISDDELRRVEGKYTQAHSEYSNAAKIAHERLQSIQSLRGKQKASVCLEEKDDTLSLSIHAKSSKKSKGSPKSRVSSKKKIN